MKLRERLAALPSGRRSKWLVLTAWLLIAFVAFSYAPRLADEQVNDSSTFLPKSAESTQVLALEEQFREGEFLPAVIVYQRESGITEADVALAEAHRAEIAYFKWAPPTLPPVVPSEDGKALQLVVPVDVAGDFTSVVDAVDELRTVATDADGLTVRVTGAAGINGDFLRAFSDLNTTLLLFTVSVVTIILLITYRSPILWLIPITTVIVAEQLAGALNWVLASNGVIVVNGQTVSIILVLVFGAGTDYALLLISRYREELRLQADRHDAMRTAVLRTSGAITASAFTVAAALLALRFSSLESTRGLGPAAALAILCAWAAALTLLPAILVALGRWVFWPFIPHAGDPSRAESGAWSRLGHSIARRPRPVWVVTALGLLVLAGSSTLLDASGLPNAERFRTTPPSVEGQALVAAHFDAGTGTPLVIIGDADSATAITEVVESNPGIGSVSEPQTAGQLVRFEATLAVAPTPAEAYPVIEELRLDLSSAPGIAIVGGDLAVDADVAAAAQRDRLVVIPLVLLIVFVILIMLLRALTAPALLMGTVILSFFAAIGVCTLIFAAVLGSTKGDVNYPIFAFIFLVALGVDYNIFLMTRVREEAGRLGTQAGTVRALAVTGGVITSAGIVLAATFSVLATLPLTGLFQIGLTVAVGVLIDALLVRSVLVPALTLDLDRRVWWPSALAKREEPEPAQVA